MAVVPTRFPDIGWLDLGCKCCACCVPCVNSRIRVNIKEGLAAPSVICGMNTYDHIAKPSGGTLVLDLDPGVAGTWTCSDTSDRKSVV